MPPSSQWSDVIQQHVQRSKSNEFKLWNRVNAFFLGNPWTETTIGNSEASLIKTSTNFVFPIVETATSVLIPPNPQVTLTPRNPLEHAQVSATEGIVNYTLDEGKWRDELAVIVQNVVKYGRGPTKTTWDAERDIPVTRFIDPRNYFFDQTAQRFEDVRYEIEATLLSKRDMEKRVAAGVYAPTVLEQQSAERYPMWLLPDGQSELNQLKSYQPWYLVWEVYDREAGRVFHYLPDDRKPILEDDLIFRPYDMLTFNYNGKDIGGISEIGLILSNQEEYNWTSTFLLNILRFGVPGILYDARVMSTDEAVKLAQAPLGSLLGVKVPSEVGGLDKAFYQRPLPAYPQLADKIQASMREGISYVSAMSDAMRAQTVGARTATELAFIEGQTKNRLRPRAMKVDGLTERVCEKHLFLAQRYMRKEKVLRLTGQQDWTPVNPATLEGVSATFKIVPYSAMETNKAVKVETLRNIQPLLVGNPNVNQRKLTEHLFELMEMPSDLLLSEEEVAAAMAAMQQPPGAPPGGAPPDAPEPPNDPTAPESELPAQVAEFSEAVATPADGASMPPE